MALKIVNGTRIYQLEFTDAQLAVIEEGLMHVPYGRAAPVINHINSQLPKKEHPEPSPVDGAGKFVG